MSNVNKKLVFYFYANENFAHSESNRIHINCINYYKNTFNEIKVVISVDDLSETSLILNAEKYFIENLSYTGSLTFIVMKNNPYYECDCFREELLLKEKNYNGLIFFAHNKGTTNYGKYKEALNTWITGAYFLSLEFCKEVESELITKNNVFYGPYLMQNKNILNKNHTYYTGTFFWINLLKHIKFCNSNDIEYFSTIDSRGYAEEYCGNFYEANNGLTSHNRCILYEGDLYNESHASYLTKILCYNENTWKEYLEFKNKMLK